MGRRSVVAAMFAAVLSAVTYLRGDLDGALALLADRLDVIERVGMPDPIVLAYRVLAESAMRRGEDARAHGGARVAARARRRARHAAAGARGAGGPGSTARAAVADRDRGGPTRGRDRAAPGIRGARVPAVPATGRSAAGRRHRVGVPRKRRSRGRRGGALGREPVHRPAWAAARTRWSRERCARWRCTSSGGRARGNCWRRC